LTTALALGSAVVPRILHLTSLFRERQRGRERERERGREGGERQGERTRAPPWLRSGDGGQRTGMGGRMCDETK